MGNKTKYITYFSLEPSVILFVFSTTPRRSFTVIHFKITYDKGKVREQ